MIDLASEHLIPLTDAPKHLPTRHGRKIHRATVFRWALKGLQGDHLETIKVGGARYTSVEALMRFVQRVQQTGSDMSITSGVPHAAPSTPRLPQRKAVIQQRVNNRLKDILNGSSDVRTA